MVAAVLVSWSGATFVEFPFSINKSQTYFDCKVALEHTMVLASTGLLYNMQGCVPELWLENITQFSISLLSDGRVMQWGVKQNMKQNCKFSF